MTITKTIEWGKTERRQHEKKAITILIQQLNENQSESETVSIGETVRNSNHGRNSKKQ